jgi:hypothetical protein
LWEARHETVCLSVCAPPKQFRRCAERHALTALYLPCHSAGADTQIDRKDSVVSPLSWRSLAMLCLSSSQTQAEAGSVWREELGFFLVQLPGAVPCSEAVGYGIMHQSPFVWSDAVLRRTSTQTLNSVLRRTSTQPCCWRCSCRCCWLRAHLPRTGTLCAGRSGRSCCWQVGPQTPPSHAGLAALAGLFRRLRRLLQQGLPPVMQPCVTALCSRAVPAVWLRCCRRLGCRAGRPDLWKTADTMDR